MVDSLTKKHIDIALLLVVASAAVWYLVQALGLIERSDLAVMISPGLFPAAVSLILLSLAAVTLVGILASKEGNNKFKVPNIKKILVVGILTVSFILAWSTWGEYIYIYIFILFLSVATVLGVNSGALRVRIAFRNAVVAALFTASLYLVFDALFGVNFA